MERRRGRKDKPSSGNGMGIGEGSFMEASSLSGLAPKGYGKEFRVREVVARFGVREEGRRKDTADRRNKGHFLETK